MISSSQQELLLLLSINEIIKKIPRLIFELEVNGFICFENFKGSSTMNIEFTVDFFDPFFLAFSENNFLKTAHHAQYFDEACRFPSSLPFIYCSLTKGTSIYYDYLLIVIAQFLLPSSTVDCILFRDSE